MTYLRLSLIYFFRRKYIENVNNPLSGGLAPTDEAEEQIDLESAFPRTAEDLLAMKLGKSSYSVAFVMIQLERTPGPKVIKLFSCSTQLSMKFEMLINIKIAKVNEIFRFKSPKPVIYPPYKC